ncbi:dihydrolipoyl dehydrogenase [Microlunatus soli]|uniref:Dihydrolipoyl dehydrogenase n=1 Tax=Microlunatus soli TaxID=630515 RepID=A0A1H1PU37_9ACTN|nr:dihydrolipoyl dehydrogenase [Microlunatus soli]SDS14603.1 dihydrolipoamide dehydrogenase [Microlunatus soli]
MSYDLVIIGAGSGGYACALRAAELGLRVALVEEGSVGGTCLHRGCIPTKAVLHAAEVADAARDGARFGVHSTLQRVDLQQVRSYAESVVSRLHKGLTGLIASRTIDVIAGRGTLIPRPDGQTGQSDEGDGAPYAVQVGDRVLTATDIVLATGSVSKSLPGVEIDGSRVLTSEHALELTELPSSAIVLGGGVIGVEFASAWRSFGVEVTVVEALPRLVPGEDPDISKALERAFGKRGIKLLTGAPMRSLEVGSDAVTLTVEDGRTVTAEVALVAVGRGPNSAGIGLEQTEVDSDRGWVTTDDRLATAVDHVYAVGDLVAGLQLAHRGFAHGIFVAEEIAARRDATALRAPVAVLDEQIPRITYSDPEIASVGLSEEAARQRYGEIETQRYDLAGNGRSQILKTQGFVKVVRAADGPVVGVTMIGARVGELIGEAQLITNWEAHPGEVAQLIHAHPTQGEALGEAHLALAGKPLHLHG